MVLLFEGGTCLKIPSKFTLPLKLSDTSTASKDAFGGGVKTIEEFQELLVGSLSVPGSSTQWVRQDVLPGLDPLVSDVLLCHPGPPGRPQQRVVVGRMVSHGVDGPA